MNRQQERGAGPKKNIFSPQPNLPPSTFTKKLLLNALLEIYSGTRSDRTLYRDVIYPKTNPSLRASSKEQSRPL
jgi:hypothetical protein